MQPQGNRSLNRLLSRALQVGALIEQQGYNAVRYGRADHVSPFTVSEPNSEASEPQHP